MGGSGSGRHTRLDARQTVEDCLVLNVNKLARDGMIVAGRWCGRLVWKNIRSGEQAASASYSCTGHVITLAYTVTRSGGEKHDVTLSIPLQTTSPQFGGARWWFTCPLIVKGRPCERRVGKLYLPSGGLYFGCRHCHDLTYTSCQESHKYDGLWRMISANTGYSPEMVKKAFESGL